jgi:hypothetical protein
VKIDNLKDLEADNRIKLKIIFKKQGVRLWLRTEPSDRIS